jgi:uncharacterized membrane protein
MNEYQLVRLVHIVSATLLFGTGLGTAFHFWRAHRTRDPRIIVSAARTTVLADWLFTAPAVILQPLTGWWLMQQLQLSWTTPWIVAALALYVVAGACWLPVVWLQIRLRDLAVDADRQQSPLPGDYHRLYRIWFALGWPAFLAVLAIFVLMVARPSFS